MSNCWKIASRSKLAGSDTRTESNIFTSINSLDTALAIAIPVAAPVERFLEIGLGNDNPPTDNSTILQIGNGNVNVVQRVLLRVHVDATFSVKLHQFGQFCIVINRAAGDDNLVKDDMNGGDFNFAAIANDEVNAALAQHLPAKLFIAFFLVEFNQRSFVAEEVLGKSTVGVKPRKYVVFAVHIFTSAAAGTDATRSQRVASDSITGLDGFYTRADCLDPAGVFMPRDVGQQRPF